MTVPRDPPATLGPESRREWDDAMSSLLRRRDVPIYDRPTGRLKVDMSNSYFYGIKWVLPDPSRPPEAVPATDREMRMADLMILGGDRDAASPRIRGIADERSGVVRDGARIKMPMEEIAEYASGYDAGRARTAAGGRKTSCPPL